MHTRLPELVGILLHIFPCIYTQMTLELSDLALGAEEEAQPLLLQVPGWDAIFLIHDNISVPKKF